MSGTATRVWSLATLATLVAFLAACSPKGASEPTTPAAKAGSEEGQAQADKEPPPSPGEPKPVQFPPVERAELDNGLELNTVSWHKLPVVYLHLVIRSGAERDPDDLPGLSQLVASMLKEGTKKRTSAELAEEVEYLGADIWTGSDEENLFVGIRALRDHLDEALDLVADVTMNPAFRSKELRKLKKRELDRLALESKRPRWLAQRAFYDALYGDHPYAQHDTTPEAVEDVRRIDLRRWHRTYARPNNAFLVVVGDVKPAEMKEATAGAFGKWRPREVSEPEYPEPPERESRSVLLVDRPQSVQSTVYIGNLAIPRGHSDWVPLEVANQVLGGSAASRLFMDLRERRSLTYGAYSRVGERVQVAPFRASAAMRNEVTGQGLDAFFEHLTRIRSEAPSASELDNARTYLSDSFPLQIDTPGKIARLVADLRVFGLPSDYWASYRERIRGVSAEEALAAAEAHIRPDEALVVVVGRAADVVEPLRRLGPVTVVDTDGNVKNELEALEGEPGGGGSEAEEADEADKAGESAESSS